MESLESFIRWDTKKKQEARIFNQIANTAVWLTGDRAVRHRIVVACVGLPVIF